MSKKKSKEASLQNVVQIDAYDSVLYSGVRDAGKIAEITKEDLDRHVIASDVFHSLYKADPKLVEDGAPFQKQLMETMMGLPEYKNLRDSTKFDDVASGIGTVQLAPDLLSSYERLKEQQQGQQQQEQGSGEFNDQVRGLLRKSLKKAQEAADQWSDFVTSWGIDKGELQKLPFKKKFEIAEQLRKVGSFKRITDLVGRFRNIASSLAETSITHGVDEIVDVTTGSNLMRCLPVEFGKLRKTRLLFFKDLLEKNLLNYELQSVEKVGYGPLIVCLDVSGSMSGEREEWAKAVILATMFLAEKQNRDFGVITFESKVQDVFWFPKGKKPTLQDKIDIASIQSDGGGTNYYDALMKAYELRELEPALRPSDILFITDGECGFTKGQLKEVLERKSELSMRVHSIAIDCSDNTCLEQFSNTVFSLEDIVSDSGSMKNIFGSVLP